MKKYKKAAFCKCGDALKTQDGDSRRGLKNKNLCWVCDMKENPDAYDK